MAETPAPSATSVARPRWRLRLCVRLIGALLPAMLLVGPAAAVWYRVGEFVDPVTAARIQSESRDADVLFGQAYSNNTRAYKAAAIQRTRPAALAIGSSRTLEFREDAFSTPFYNAGGTVDCLEDLGAGLFSLPPDARPQVIILGVDPWWFNGAYEAPGCKGSSSAYDSPLRNFATAWRDTWSDYFSDKFAATQLRTSTQAGPTSPIGLNAWVNGNGFRKDGSYRYGSIMERPDDPRTNPDVGFHATIDRVQSGSGRFVPADVASEPAIAAFETFLRECRSRGIHVVAFLPPFPHAVIEALRDRADRNRYFWSLGARLRTVAEANGVIIEDLSDLATLGMSDDEAIDGYHCSEKAYLAVLLRLAEHDPVLRTHLRPISELETRLARASRRFIAF